MINKKMKTLEQMGIIVINKTPNFVHGLTQKEYNQKIKEKKMLLSLIQEILSEHLNLIQTHILEITIRKLSEIFEFYYNTNIYRIDIGKNRDFKHYIKELDNFVVRYLQKGSSEEKKIKKVIQKIKKDFLEQTKTLRSIETKINRENKKPFRNVVKKISRNKPNSRLKEAS